jgi:hypothetical protein
MQSEDLNLELEMVHYFLRHTKNPYKVLTGITL